MGICFVGLLVSSRWPCLAKEWIMIPNIGIYWIDCESEYLSDASILIARVKGAPKRCGAVFHS